MDHGTAIQRYVYLSLILSVLFNSVVATPFNLFDFGFGDDEPEDDGASTSVAGTKNGSVSLEGPLGSVSAGGSIGGAGSVGFGNQPNNGPAVGFPSPGPGHAGFGDNSGANAFTGVGAGPQGAGAIGGAEAGQQFQQNYNQPFVQNRPQQRLQHRGPPPPPSFHHQPPPGYSQERNRDPYYQPRPTQPQGYENTLRPLPRPAYKPEQPSYAYDNQKPVYKNYPPVSYQYQPPPSTGYRQPQGYAVQKPYGNPKYN